MNGATILVVLAVIAAVVAALHTCRKQGRGNCCRDCRHCGKCTEKHT